MLLPAWQPVGSCPDLEDGATSYDETQLNCAGVPVVLRPLRHIVSKHGHVVIAAWQGS